jgi:hypothetical protein
MDAWICLVRVVDDPEEVAVLHHDVVHVRGAETARSRGAAR